MSHLPTDYDQDILAEIDTGLVLHLDPDVLEKEGGICKCKPELRVQGVHFFLCLGKATNESFWTPLYSRDGKGRVILDIAAKRGHPNWCAKTSYAHEETIWLIKRPYAIYLAAGKARDKSRKGNRNSFSVGLLTRR